VTGFQEPFPRRLPNPGLRVSGDTSTPLAGPVLATGFYG
jgi:hypothetical protein